MLKSSEISCPFPVIFGSENVFSVRNKSQSNHILIWSMIFILDYFNGFVKYLIFLPMILYYLGLLVFLLLDPFYDGTFFFFFKFWLFCSIRFKFISRNFETEVQSGCDLIAELREVLLSESTSWHRLVLFPQLSPGMEGHYKVLACFSLSCYSVERMFSSQP